MLKPENKKVTPLSTISEIKVADSVPIALFPFSLEI